MVSAYRDSYLARLRRDESGQGLVEYTLIIALTLVVFIAALEVLGTGIQGAFDDLAGLLDEAGT